MQGLFDVLSLQIWIFHEDFLNGHPIRHQIHHKETVIRIPRMQARPPIIWGLKVIRLNIFTSTKMKPSLELS